MTDDARVFEYIGSGNVKVEWFEYRLPDVPELLVWNVTGARWLVAHGGLLTTVEVPRVEMQNIVDGNQWDPAHAATTDPTLPGIGAPLVYDNQIIYQLIDGIHRCARALQLGMPFRAHLLTDEAARACYRGPDRFMPWGQR